mmetsp:Transcript_5001/g.13163  ORF Transcript_5001/g.13163 Transcript_5001/m.13163 type:complete len:92 (-) Transcript_5001:159-434(-)|eukprot:7377234-Prymnesium_polylepis.1
MLVISSSASVSASSSSAAAAAATPAAPGDRTRLAAPTSTSVALRVRMHLGDPIAREAPARVVVVAIGARAVGMVTIALTALAARAAPGLAL